MLRPRDLGDTLITACDAGNFPDVRSSVSSGASVDFQEGLLSRTGAILCCIQGHPEILQYLLEQGANAELADPFGWNALDFSAYHNKQDCVTVLLAHGVAVDAPDTAGYTALWIASYGGHLSIVQLLVRSGADIEIADYYYGMTPIVIARLQGHPAVVKYLEIESKWRRDRVSPD
jgi:ankyrin repeat protein